MAQNQNGGSVAATLVQDALSKEAMARKAELDRQAEELAAKEAELMAKEAELQNLKRDLDRERVADAEAEKKNAANRWKVNADCFAGNVLYHEGDTVSGGDFSGNPNFTKLNG